MKQQEVKMPPKLITVRIPGSCGELVQGSLNGEMFLVTCPVDLFSQAAVSEGNRLQGAGEKVSLAVQKTLAYIGAQGTVQVEIQSDLPMGKGMASSSADICAAAYAAALYHGRHLTTRELAEIALAIEPTDGIFYPGIVRFDHIYGTSCEPLGDPPALKIAVLDLGGEVDTLSFNKRRDLVNLNQEKEAEVDKAFQLLRRGLKNQDALLIGEAATMSAFANQRILYKPGLERIYRIAQSFGAVGINIAHSGTVVGLLFSDRSSIDGIITACIEELTSAMDHVHYLFTLNLISGGIWVEEEGEWVFMKQSMEETFMK